MMEPDWMNPRQYGYQTEPLGICDWSSEPHEHHKTCLNWRPEQNRDRQAIALVVSAGGVLLIVVMYVLAALGLR